MTPHADTEILSAYLDGEVPTSERARLERHLAACAECSARKSALEGVIRSVRGLPPVTATEAEHLAMRRAVLEAAPGRAPSFPLRSRSGSRSGPELEPELGRVPKRPAWRLFAAAAAVAAVLAGVVGIVVVRGGGPNATTTASAPAPSASPTSSPGPRYAPSSGSPRRRREAPPPPRHRLPPRPTLPRHSASSTPSRPQRPQRGRSPTPTGRWPPRARPRSARAPAPPSPRAPPCSMRPR